MIRSEKHDLIIGQLFNWFQRYNYSVSSAAGNTRGADLTISYGAKRVLVEVNRRWHLNAASRPKILERHREPGTVATVFITTHPENLRKQITTIPQLSEYSNIFVLGEDEYCFLLPPLILHLLGLPRSVSREHV